MKSLSERYDNDASFHQLVDAMHSMIDKCYFSPSKMREAAVLASIHYELQSTRRYYTVPLDVNEAIAKLCAYRHENRDNEDAQDTPP
jgi:hypothetical protein